MADIALAAIRPLLRLIHNEAQQLRGVRRDVRFISDEMESMKGFLLNLVRNKEGAGGDHQVRAWMAQVMELAYDSTNCVEDYARSRRAHPHDRNGLVGHLQRVARLPERMLIRRRVGARIRRLKVRAQEVGERQQRYAVAAPLPPRMDTTPSGVAVEWKPLAAQRAQERRRSTHPAKDSPQWAVLSGPDILTEAKGELLQWLAVKPEDYGTRPWPSVLAVVTPDGVDGASLVDQVPKHCKHSSEADLLKFDRTVCITISRPPFLLVILLDMLRQLHPEDYFKSMGNGVETWDLAQVTEKLTKSLRGKRLLVVLSDLDYPEIWAKIKASMDKFECSAGSAVVFCTKDREVAANCSPNEAKVYSLVDFYNKKAVSLIPSKFDPHEDRQLRLIIKQVLSKCTPDVYCMNLFLHALLSNPTRTVEELETLSRSLGQKQCPTRVEKQNLMITFCYQGLHKDYQNCLWYSTVFTRGAFKVRRASLLRRWVAEGLIKRVGQSSATAEAERCFDALFTQKLLLPREVGGTGKIKSCGPNALFSPTITDDTTEEAFLDTNQLPADLQLHFSIRNGIQLRSMTESKTSEVDSIMSPQKNSKMEQQMKSMMAFLKSLPTSSSFRLLRVLELEGFKGFKKRHLKNICKIHQLKYLSLRDTDVAQLPKELEQLLLLETLDIRGTNVQVFKAMLPMLKHLLAGCIDYASGQEDTVKSKESFSTVRLPRNVARMEKLEILSHVKVSDSAKEVINAGRKLRQLKKLGVVLSGKKANLNDLFLEIDELNTCLLSLSIRVEPPVNWDVVDGATLIPPRHLESLHICGVRGWLPARINELHQLAKITLRDTKLKEGALVTLGSLRGLLCLRLHYHSFAEAALIFGAGRFDELMDLVIEDDNLRSISFALGTAPKLGTMVWSFTRMESLSGINNLSSLQRLELNRGRCDSNGLDVLRQDIAAHCNRVRFSLNPPENS